MKYVFSETNRLNDFCNEYCVRINDNTFKIKKEIGSGEIQLYDLAKGFSLYFLDFTYNDPFLSKWDYSDNSPKEFFLFHNLSEPKKEVKSSIADTVEPGAVAFTQNNIRRRLFLPNERYQAIMMNFTESWLIQLNQLIHFPEKLISSINSSSNLYLNSETTALSKIVLNQIVNYKNEEKGSLNTYLKLKCVELIFLFFTEKFNSVSNTNSPTTIHYSDLSKLNEFMGQINNNIDNIPNIKSASSDLGMSESKFQRVFKTLIGTTYYDYIFKLKMDTSIDLLLNKYSVTEVAYRTGYSSIGNFTAAFKRFFNFLPSEI